MQLSDHELILLLREDAPYSDITTTSLKISDLKGKIQFLTRSSNLTKISLSEESARLCELAGLSVTHVEPSGKNLENDCIILEAVGNAAQLHLVWKTIQNLLDFGCGISTYMDQLIQKAKAINPNISVATTRKTIPYTKLLATKAIEFGGGKIHRYGLSDSILVFENHRVFFNSINEQEQAIKQLINENPEKKVLVEIHHPDEAEAFAALGIHILQMDKLSPAQIQQVISSLRSTYPHLQYIATGGITLENIDEYASSGVDIVVTSSAYHALTANIKVRIMPL